MPISRLSLRMRSLLASIILVVGFSLSAIPARAEFWGTNYTAAIIDHMFEQLSYQIEGMLLTNLKGAAIQMLNQQVQEMLGGGSGGNALYITNYQDYIQGIARDNAQAMMNDFFTNSTRGKYASANYMEIGSVAGVSIDMDMAGLVQDAMQSVGIDGRALQYNFDQLSSGSDIVNGLGSMRDLNLLVSNPMNNPMGASMVATEMYNRTLSENVDIQKIKAMSSGFIPNESGGEVVTPAGSIEAMTTSVETLSNDVIASAENYGQIIGGMISSYATKAISRMVQKGVGKAKSELAGSFGNIGNQISNYASGALNTSGIGSRFSGEFSQQINVRSRSMTSPAVSQQHFDP